MPSIDNILSTDYCAFACEGRCNFSTCPVPLISPFSEKAFAVHFARSQHRVCESRWPLQDPAARSALLLRPGRRGVRCSRLLGSGSSLHLCVVLVRRPREWAWPAVRTKRTIAAQIAPGTEPNRHQLDPRDSVGVVLRSPLPASARYCHYRVNKRCCTEHSGAHKVALPAPSPPADLPSHVTC